MEACTCVQSTCVVCKSVSGVEENNRTSHTSHMGNTQSVNNGEKKRGSLPYSSPSVTLSETQPSIIEPSANNFKVESAETQMKEKKSQSASASSFSKHHTVSSTHHGKVALGEICGYTQDGVASYSNGSHNTWLNEKHIVNNLFMGYKWQCVEFARRWLWQAHHLLLPQRNCACNFTDLTYVYKPVATKTNEATKHTSYDALHAEEEEEYEYEEEEEEIHTLRRQEDVKINRVQSTRESIDQSILANGKESVEWIKVPCRFVKQGSSTTPPRARSLIIYPRSWHSPWGHIGIITQVDIVHHSVCVADQNRFFHSWKSKPYSAVFALRQDAHHHYYIDDFEGYKCSGWIEIDGVI